MIWEGVNDILDDWDPIGVNHFQDMRVNEYISYVPRIIRNFLSNLPTYGSLNALQIELIDNSSEEMKSATHQAAREIDALLEGCGIVQLKELFPSI